MRASRFSRTSLNHTFMQNHTSIFMEIIKVLVQIVNKEFSAWPNSHCLWLISSVPTGGLHRATSHEASVSPPISAQFWKCHEAPIAASIGMNTVPWRRHLLTWKDVGTIRNDNTYTNSKYAVFSQMFPDTNVDPKACRRLSLHFGALGRAVHGLQHEAGTPLVFRKLFVFEEMPPLRILCHVSHAVQSTSV